MPSFALLLLLNKLFRQGCVIASDVLKSFLIRSSVFASLDAANLHTSRLSTRVVFELESPPLLVNLRANLALGEWYSEQLAAPMPCGASAACVLDHRRPSESRRAMRFKFSAWFYDTVRLHFSLVSRVWGRLGGAAGDKVTPGVVCSDKASPPACAVV